MLVCTFNVKFVSFKHECTKLCNLVEFHQTQITEFHICCKSEIFIILYKLIVPQLVYDNSMMVNNK